jgi:hypothetical protein
MKISEIRRRSKKNEYLNWLLCKKFFQVEFSCFFLEDTIEANRNTYGEGISKRKERERDR